MPQCFFQFFILKWHPYDIPSNILMIYYRTSWWSFVKHLYHSSSIWFHVIVIKLLFDSIFSYFLLKLLFSFFVFKSLFFISVFKPLNVLIYFMNFMFMRFMLMKLICCYVVMFECKSRIPWKHLLFLWFKNHFNFDSLNIFTS